MTKHTRTNTLALTILTITVLTCWTPTRLLGKPTVRRGTIRLGYSLRLPRYSWGKFSCEITNPDPKARKVMIRVSSENAFTQRNSFADEVTIPPKSIIEYETDIMVENSENYVMETYVDGVKTSGRGEEILLKLLQARMEQIGVLNDHPTISLGAFVQLKHYKDKVFSTNFRSRNFPENWQTLRDLAALVIIRPDFDNFNARQQKALLDYVKQGGVVIFACPEALLDMKDTPFAPLAPVNPVRLRRVSDLPGVRDVIPSFDGWRSGETLPFLESTEKGDGLTFMKIGDFPLFRWKRYGLGSCRFSAIPLCQSHYQGKEETSWDGLLRFFFNHQQFFSETLKYSECLDAMTGFTIPKVIVIKILFAVYFAILAIIMFGGLWLKSPRISWGVGTLVAVAATLGILHKAKQKSSEKGKVLSAIEMSVAGIGDFTPTEGFYGVFSDANLALTIDGRDENSSLSAISPNTASILPTGFRTTQVRGRSNSATTLRESYEVKRVDGTPSLANVNIRAHSVRQFAGNFSLANDIVAAADDLPVLRYGKNGPVLEPWIPPKGLPHDKAFLIMPSGGFDLKRREDGALTLNLTGGKALFQSDHLSKTIRDALTEAHKKSCPYVALVSKLRETAIPKPTMAKIQGRRVVIVPTRERCEAPDVLVDAAQVSLTAADSSTRMVMIGNALKSNLSGRGASTYRFKFKLPPALSSVIPREIRMRFQYANSGGNIAAHPALQLPSGTLIEGTREGAEFVFKGAEIAEALDPVEGTGIIQVVSKEIDPNLTQAQKLRGNKWEITELSLAVEGALPRRLVPFTY